MKVHKRENGWRCERMKLGLLSAILSNHSFEEVINKASEVGYESVEMACWPKGEAERRYAGVTHIDVSQINQEKIKYIKNYCFHKKVEIAALGYYPNILDPDKEKSQLFIQHLKTLISLSKALNVNKVITFIGKDKDLSVEENIQLFKEIWVPIIQYAEKESVWVGIENCPMYFTKDEWPGGLNLASAPYIWRQLFTLIDSEYFGLAYDPSHLHAQGMDYIKPLYEFKHKIKHIHLKDILVYKDKIDEYGIFTYPLNYMSPKIPGRGGIDWSSFIAALYDIKYEGSACVEIEDKSFEDSGENIIKAVEISFRHLKQFVK